jgi:phospholipid/cholesterol/gamma-HCH transport system permease protein
LKNNTSSEVSPQIQWEVLSPQKAKLTLTGSLDTDSIAKIWKDVTDRQGLWMKNNSSSQKSLTIDASNISYLDGSGVAFLIDIQHQQEINQGQFELNGLDPKYQTLLNRFHPIDPLYPKPIKKEKDGLITSLGKASYEIYNDTRDLVIFIGKITAGFFWILRKPYELRWNDLVTVASQAGIFALPIITLVAFLIGVILAFQTAVGLMQFGATTYVAPLVSKGIFRELGPLITAILFAGRSSAAFAAEIGTMTVNNEVDALTTAGINPIRFLVMPRVLAGILVVPILTIFANLISVCAVIFTMTLYKIPFITSYNGLLNMVNLSDIYSGLIKSVIFGIVVASVGCLRGMQTGTGAAAVGISTTRAVVSSIVLIVFVDGIFAFISYRTGF